MIFPPGIIIYLMCEMLPEDTEGEMYYFVTFTIVCLPVFFGFFLKTNSLC